MKRSTITMMVFLLLCTYIHSNEFPNFSANIHSSRYIRSSGSDTFELRINNGGDTTLYNIELSVVNNDDLDMHLNKTRMDILQPKENLILYLEINNSKNYFFDKETFVSLRVYNEEYESNYRFRFTIKPIEYFWFFIIIIFAAIMTISFVIIFIKLTKGDKNAG